MLLGIRMLCFFKPSSRLAICHQKDHGVAYRLHLCENVLHLDDHIWTLHKLHYIRAFLQSITAVRGGTKIGQVIDLRLSCLLKSNGAKPTDMYPATAPLFSKGYTIRIIFFISGHLIFYFLFRFFAFVICLSICAMLLYSPLDNCYSSQI